MLGRKRRQWTAGWSGRQSHGEVRAETRSAQAGAPHPVPLAEGAQVHEALLRIANSE
jgi:hypothetical protein